MVEVGGDSGHAPARALYESEGFVRWPVARYFKDLRVNLPQLLKHMRKRKRRKETLRRQKLRLHRKPKRLQSPPKLRQQRHLQLTNFCLKMCGQASYAVDCPYESRCAPYGDDAARLKFRRRYFIHIMEKIIWQH